MQQSQFRPRLRGLRRAREVRRWFFMGSMLVLLMTTALRAQVELLPASNPLLLFGGATRPVEGKAHNAGTEERTLDLHFRLWQASSSTALPVGETQSAKQVRILAGQTVVETIPIVFPAVQQATDLVVRWADGEGKALGATRVTLLPGDLLKQLGVLTAGQPVALFDPDKELGPLLERQGVAQVDLAEAPQADAERGLAVVGPFSFPPKTGSARPTEVENFAKRCRAMVWVEAPSPRGSGSGAVVRVLVRDGRTVVVVPSTFLSNLSESASAQWQLVQAAAIALKPQLAQPAQFQP